MLERTAATIAEMRARGIDAVGTGVQPLGHLRAVVLDARDHALARQGIGRERTAIGQTIAQRADRTNVEDRRVRHCSSKIPCDIGQPTWAGFESVNAALKVCSDSIGHRVGDREYPGPSDRMGCLSMKSVITAVSLLALAAANLAPGLAAAQDYDRYPPPPPPPPAETCHHDRTASTVVGAVIGAGLGALLGAALAAEGHGGDGAALGAGLGGVSGGVIGSSSAKCPDNAPPPRPYGANDYGPDYAQGAPPAPPPGYQDQGYGYPPPPPPGDGQEQGYANPPRPPGGYDQDQGYGAPPPSGEDEFNEPPPGSDGPPR